MTIELIDDKQTLVGNVEIDQDYIDILNLGNNKPNRVFSYHKNQGKLCFFCVVENIKK